MAETTWFEEKFIDHPLARDTVLVLFLVLGFGIPFKLLFGLVAPGTPINYLEGIGAGVLFAALWLALMEALARRNGSSMFRYFMGEDPLEDE
ncbi:MAG: hypothetical protein ABEK04_05350 [Candidatus Nanohalobium sp.]